MSSPKKAVARRTRRDERDNMRNHSRLLASIDRTIPEEPKKGRMEPIKPLNDAQARYDAAIKGKDIVFGVGPAGTGKTWFAVQRAAEALRAGEISKIFLTRPAIEVGRGMGFLPGELEEKYEPYLAPLREAFIDALGVSHYENLLRSKKIEPVPLAFMRGRTIKNGWLLADEMQNATAVEYKMLLSRIGENAKFIINGDGSQVDEGIDTGILDAIYRLKGHPKIGIVSFDEGDIVRCGLCQDIVKLYEC